MKKSDLKTGMLVKTRNHEIYCVIGDKLCRGDGYLLLSDYNNNLIMQEICRTPEYDIIAIADEPYNPLYNKFFTEKEFDKRSIWERYKPIDWTSYPLVKSRQTGNIYRVFDYSPDDENQFHGVKVYDPKNRVQTYEIVYWLEKSLMELHKYEE